MVTYSNLEIAGPDEYGTMTLILRPPTDTARRCSEALVQALRLFYRRQIEYGEKSAGKLGLQGQYADINRKTLKLERYLWDGVPVPDGAESIEQVCFDLIGHLLLTVDMLEGRG